MTACLEGATDLGNWVSFTTTAGCKFTTRAQCSSARLSSSKYAVAICSVSIALVGNSGSGENESQNWEMFLRLGVLL
jgi:hypothetical protein